MRIDELTDKVEMQESREGSSLELPNETEEAKPHRHTYDKVEPEACQEHWTQKQAPYLERTIGPCRIIDDKIVGRACEPRYEVEREACQNDASANTVISNYDEDDLLGEDGHG